MNNHYGWNNRKGLHARVVAENEAAAYIDMVQMIFRRRGRVSKSIRTTC